MAEFDVVVYGATGYTGKIVMEYIGQTYGVGGEVSWAIAGRNESKLVAARDEVAEYAPAVRDVPMIIANSSDRESLDAMVARTKVMLTTVGPYLKYGSELVAACAASGTHYVDLTGEACWIRKMIDAHGAEAERTGAKIVPSCGFDSIPSDLGTLMMGEAMLQRDGRQIDSLTYYCGPMKGGASGGTLDTMYTICSDKSLIKMMVTPYLLNDEDQKPTVPFRDAIGMGYDSTLGRWTSPFFMAGHNVKVVYRSLGLQNFPYGRSMRYQELMCYRGVKGFFQALATVVIMPLVLAMATFGPTRSILKRVLPKPGEGLTREERENGYFNTYFVAQSVPEPDKPRETLCGRIVGPHDPGYLQTAIMLTHSALALLDPNIPNRERGGILTPATAMGNVLIERLRGAGMTFEVCPPGELPTSRPRP